tara:strand:+ start:2940 stop:4358 length:1419 start_codon:yes stop_codon:yes gene_type:complete
MNRAWTTKRPTKTDDDASTSATVIKVQPSSSIEKIPWRLPPSKSHAIRWLALAAQSNQDVVIHNLSQAGQDILSMRRCLNQLGVRITDLDQHGEPLADKGKHPGQPPEGTESWCVEGVGVHGLQLPSGVLDAGNSGTSLRILMALCARFDAAITIDGDASLRSRNHDVMVGALQQLGVRVSRSGAQNLPLCLEGPWTPPASISLDISSSSQPTTALCLAACALPVPLTVEDHGTGVSLRHSELTKRICEQTGANPSIHNGELTSWNPNIENSSTVIPPDASMLSFALLAAKVSSASVDIQHVPGIEDALGHEVLFELAQYVGLQITGSIINAVSKGQSTTVDLRHGNDLITPVAALLALAGGGEITGAEHAAYKETDRTIGTVDLLKQFGLDASYDQGRLLVPGGQELVSPKGLVRTFGDHRMQMTALVLAMGCKEEVIIEGAHLHRVADPEALERWRLVGAEIESFLQQPR